MSVSEDISGGRGGELINWKWGSQGNCQVSWGLYKWVPAVTFILSAFPLSVCVFRFLFAALFHHLSHVLYKSYLIFSVKGMTVFYLALFPLPISFPVPSSSWHSPIFVLPSITPTHFLAEKETSFVLRRWNNGRHVFFALSLYTLSHGLPVKCHGVCRLGRPLLCGCRRQGAGALMWNSLRETRRKLISLPGMRSLDTAALTIHPSSITSAFISLSPHVSCAWIQLWQEDFTSHVHHLHFPSFV